MFQFSEIKAVDLSSLPVVGRKRSEFTNKLLALEVGQGFEVGGMLRNNLASRVNLAGKVNKRSFGVATIGDGNFLVFRKA